MSTARGTRHRRRLLIMAMPLVVAASGLGGVPGPTPYHNTAALVAVESEALAVVGSAEATERLVSASGGRRLWNVLLNLARSVRGLAGTIFGVAEAPALSLQLAAVPSPDETPSPSQDSFEESAAVPNTPSGGDRDESQAARRGPMPIARVTVNLPYRVWEVVGELADQQGVSKTEVLRRAISTEK